MKTPILETSRLWLKPLKEEDAPGAFLWTGDPKVSWYMRYETHGSLEDTKQWLREEEKQLDSDLLYDFGFHKKDSDELIGSGGLTFNQQQGIWELGCNLRRDCWNQGYGTEAAAAILSFAENTLHIHRVMARRAKENTASGRAFVRILYFDVCANSGLCQRTVRFRRYGQTPRRSGGRNCTTW